MLKWVSSLALIATGLAFRFIFWKLPCFGHVYYDEAVPGLMAMDMLEGRFSPFYWGAPYLGSLESILAAFFFSLFSTDTFWLRMSPFISSLFLIAGMLILSRKMNGNRFPVYTALFLTIPPLVFNEYSLSPMGGYMQTIALGTWFLILLLQALKNSEASFPLVSISIAGLIAGIGFWTFMMILPFLGAGALVFFIRLRSEYRGKALVLLSLFFFIGSLPWWMGNIENGWLTFRMKGGLAHFSVYFDQLVNFINISSMLFGRCREFAHHPWGPLITGLTSLVWISAFMSFFFSFRNRLKNRQETNAVSLMLFSGLLFFAACFIFSQNGREQLSRYGLPLYVFLGIPFLSAFERFAAWKPVLHIPFLSILIVLVLPYNLAFMQFYAHDKKRMEGPEEVIRYLEQQGISKAYAHFTTAQSVSFESKKKIICSDFGGFRNIEFLKLVDDASKTALITDSRMNLPNPDALETQLKSLVCSYIRRDMGSYTVFHDFTFSPNAYEDISALLIPIQENKKAPFGQNLLDRHFSTLWTSPAEKNSSLTFNCQTPVALCRIELVSGTDVTSIPQGILVEGAQEAGQWLTLAQIPGYIPVFQEFNGNIRLLPNGHIDIRFKETPLRQIRLTLSGKNSWGIAELFVYKQHASLQPDKKEALSLIQSLNPQEKVFLPPALIPSVQKHLPGLTTPRLIQDKACYRDRYLFWDYNERVINPFGENGFLLESIHLNGLKQFFTDNHLPYSVHESQGWSYVSLPALAPLTDKTSLFLTRLTHPQILYDSSLHEIQLSYPLKPDTLLKKIRISLRNPDLIKLNDLKITLFNKGNILKKTPLCLDRWIWADGFIARKTDFQTDFLFSETLSADRVMIGIPELMLNSLTLKKIEAEMTNPLPEPPSLPDSKGWQKHPVNALFDGKAEINTIAFSSHLLKPSEYLMFYCSGKSLQKTLPPFNLFIHFLNSKGELLFQEDIQIHSPYSKNFDKNGILQFEHLIPVPKTLKDEANITALIGLCESDRPKRWKIKTKQPQENRALILKNFQISSMDSK